MLQVRRLTDAMVILNLIEPILVMYNNYFHIHNIVAPKEAHKILIKNHSMFHICSILVYTVQILRCLCDTDAASQKIDRCNGHSAPVLTYKTYHHMPHFSGVVNRSFYVRCFVIQMLQDRRLTDAMVILPLIWLTKLMSLCWSSLSSLS